MSIEQPSEQPSRFRMLLRQVRAGTPHAAAELVNEYGPVIRQVVRRRLDPRMRSKFDSIDFEQMVWASIFRSDGCNMEFETPADFCRFLVALARNKVISEHRRRFNTQKHQVTRERVWDSDQVAEQQSIDPTPSQVAQARELASRFLRGHSNRNRRIMEMRLQGASYDDIAAELGIDTSTVRRTIARITRSQLRKPAE